MLGLSSCSKLNWDSYIVSVSKTVSKKILSLIRSVKYLSSEIALYLRRSTMWPCMEYYYHVWSDASSCYIDMLDKRQKRAWTFDSSSKCSQRTSFL